MSVFATSPIPTTVLPSQDGSNQERTCDEINKARPRTRTTSVLQMHMHMHGTSSCARSRVKNKGQQASHFPSKWTRPRWNAARDGRLPDQLLAPFARHWQLFLPFSCTFWLGSCEFGLLGSRFFRREVSLVSPVAAKKISGENDGSSWCPFLCVSNYVGSQNVSWEKVWGGYLAYSYISIGLSLDKN